MASGDTLCKWTAPCADPAGNADATPDVRNAHPVLDFDAGTDEYAYFSDVLPRNYAGGGITAKIHFAMTSATSGNVVWVVAFERIGTSQDLDAASFASDGTVTAAANGTSGIPTIGSIAFTDGAAIDSIAVGELFRLRIGRNADDGSDTATGDAELLAIELIET